MEIPAAETTPQEGGVCPHCGQAAPAGALAGWCPACLLRQGAAGDTGFPNTFTAPTVEELADLFPQLEILGLIGAGGMGAVYKARQRELDRVVALKILPPGIGERPGFAERFTREAKALAKLSHPGIVIIHDTGRVDGLYYLLMEFVDGPNLRQVIDGGRVSPREALAIVPMICDALQYAHDAGIVHRDIKPENILLDRQGRVKVADFGLAKLIGSDDSDDAGTTSAMAGVTEAGQLMGTPQYMAPEQIDHPSEVDHRADIYSLGVVLYQMLTGEMPGSTLEPPSRKVELDIRLDEVVMRALEKDPGLRYQQVSQVKQSVETILSPTTTHPPEGDPPMEIKFNCPNCQQKLSVEETAAGSEVSCPRCAQVMLVPSLIEEPVAPANLPNIPKLSAPPPRMSAGRKLPPALPGTKPKQTNGLALWSMILAGIGLIPLLGIATGAIGLVLGIVALAKGTTSKGLAISGTVVGCLAALMIPFHLKMIKVSMAAGKFAIGTTQCVANLVVIGNGISKYRENNNGMYPPTLETLAKEGLLEEKVLRCPANDGKSGYEYARPSGSDATGLLVWDRAPHRAMGNEVSGRNALNTAYKVDFLTEQQFRAAPKATGRNAPTSPRPRPPVAETPNIKPRPDSTPKVIPPPLKPTTVETNLEALAEAAPREKKPFLNFLARESPTPEQREAVIAAVKPLLNDVDCGDPAFEAFKVWAGPEQVPDLMEMVRVAPRSHRGRESMKLLSRMGDPRAAEPIAAAMLDFHGLREAKAALAAMGAIAKPTLLPYFHHENGHAREAARELLRGYQATDEEILAQSIQSLGAEEPGSRRSALEYLATAKLDPETKVKTARAVQRLVSDADNRVRETARTAMKALATPADADFLLELVKSDDQPTRDFAIDLLVQFKDVRVAKPLAQMLGDPHLTYRAGDKLTTLGAIAESAVIPILSSDVGETRKRAADILAKIGTSASLRALEAGSKDKDFFARAAAATAVSAIKARIQGGKQR